MSTNSTLYKVQEKGKNKQTLSPSHPLCLLFRLWHTITVSRVDNATVIECNIKLQPTLPDPQSQPPALMTFLVETLE